VRNRYMTRDDDVRERPESDSGRGGQIVLAFFIRVELVAWGRVDASTY
jgi:hypothetical protein